MRVIDVNTHHTTMGQCPLYNKEINLIHKISKSVLLYYDRKTEDFSNESGAMSVL
jgi:hypothetical protein